MKHFKLLKDMPTIKANTVFVSDGSYVTQVDCDTKINIEDILNFNDWFEEIKEFEGWKPKEGERYKYLDTIGEVNVDYFAGGNSIDEFQLSISNCYPLDTPDELVIKEQKHIPQALHRLRLAAKKAWFEFNGSEGPDWSDLNTDKHCIHYDFSDKTFDTYWVQSYRYISEIYFPTEESAQWVIDNMRDDLKLVMGIE